MADSSIPHVMDATHAIPATDAKARAATATGADTASKIAAAYVNPGWQPRLWAARLRQLAGRCEELHPQHAADLRAWAEAVDAAHPRRGGLDL